MRKEDQERLYAEAMGQEKLEQQKRLAKETCPECFGKHGRHARQCLRGHRLAQKKQQ